MIDGKRNAANVGPAKTIAKIAAKTPRPVFPAPMIRNLIRSRFTLVPRSTEARFLTGKK